MQAHYGAFGVAPGGGDGAAGALFRQHGGAVRDRVTVFHHPPAPQGRELTVKGGRAAGEVVREVVTAELRRVPGRFPKCFRGQQENMTPFIKIGACRKSLFAPLTSFQNFYEVLKTWDFNGAGHPSWVSRAHPSFPLRRSCHLVDRLRSTVSPEGDGRL